MSYHQFANETERFGSFEVFYIAWPGLTTEAEEHKPQGKGWYWQAGFPGCMPDGQAIGPFVNEQEAINDAMDFI